MSIASLDIGGIVEGAFKGLDGLFTSDEERAAAKLALMTEMRKPHVLQALTNIEEAKHAHWFVAGWRPALGWVCAFGLAYGLIFRDLAVFLVATFSETDISRIPEIDMAQIISLTVTLLGLATQRTVEKMSGVSTRRVGGD